MPSIGNATLSMDCAGMRCDALRMCRSKALRILTSRRHISHLSGSRCSRFFFHSSTSVPEAMRRGTSRVMRNSFLGPQLRSCKCRGVHSAFLWSLWMSMGIPTDFTSTSQASSLARLESGYTHPPTHAPTHAHAYKHRITPPIDALIKQIIVDTKPDFPSISALHLLASFRLLCLVLLNHCHVEKHRVAPNCQASHQWEFEN